MEIVNHRLVDCGAVHLVCAKNTRRMVNPGMIVLHYTAGVSCMSSALYLIRPEVKASAHLVLGRKGEVVQLMPFNVEAWHAGRSEYAGVVGLNRCSIGIELDNLGRLDFREGRFVAECGVEVPPGEVYAEDVNGVAVYWHRYTECQKMVLRQVCRLLERCYPIRYIVGHSDVTSRKQDPGPELREFMRY